MKRWFAKRRSVVIAAGAAIISGAAFLGFQQFEGDYFFRVNKSIDVFGRVYKEVLFNYVDDVDPERFMESGIDGLLNTLDPYTTFISEKDAGEVELITAGKYGGIGITIGLRDGFITILTLMEGYSAQRQGLLPGDRILEIDGKSLVGTKPENVRPMTRGEPGTEVHMKIEREGQKLEFTVIREEIQLKNLTFAEFVDSGVAYARLERFSRGAGEELRLALRELKLRGPINSVILDLRDNPGGLLDAAVDVVERFAPRGSLVVSTRGRKPESERKYFVSEEPMLPSTPLVVLINRGSASASEIVAGAIQDLDRGVILGTRSFGKGLVQTIAPLSFNAQLKITTAKYYTPSGRCIQEINYARRSKDGVFEVFPDSLKKEFKTLKGRTELEAGGITPDSTLPLPDHSNLFNELIRRSLPFKFAARYGASHAALPASPDSLLHAFEEFLAESHFSYADEGEVKVRDLAAFAEKEKYSPEVRAEIESLRKRIAGDYTRSLAQHAPEVLPALKQELMARWNGDKGRIEASLADDVQVNAAIGILRNQKVYSRLLRAR